MFHNLWSVKVWLVVCRQIKKIHFLKFSKLKLKFHNLKFNNLESTLPFISKITCNVIWTKIRNFLFVGKYNTDFVSLMVNKTYCQISPPPQNKWTISPFIHGSWCVWQNANIQEKTIIVVWLIGCYIPLDQHTCETSGQFSA